MGAMDRALSDLSRRFDNLLTFGTIAAVDHAHAKVKLLLSGRSTGWLPYPAEIGANFRRWRPLRPGTQVLAACPGGNPANAVIIQILYTDALPPPAEVGTHDLIQFDDGTLVRYDAAAKTLDVVSAGDIGISAPAGTIVIDGKNVVIRTGDEGYFQFDHAGKATRITHQGGNAFQADSWQAGAVTGGPTEHGFHPPKVTSPGEDG